MLFQGARSHRECKAKWHIVEELPKTRGLLGLGLGFKVLLLVHLFFCWWVFLLGFGVYFFGLGVQGIGFRVRGFLKIRKITKGSILFSSSTAAIIINPFVVLFIFGTEWAQERQRNYGCSSRTSLYK